MDCLFAHAFPVGIANGRAVDGYHLPAGYLMERVDPYAEAAAKLHRVDLGEDIAQYVMGGDAPIVRQETPQPVLLDPSEVADGFR